MNARIEKKLSKKLLKLAPKLFRGVWIDKEPSLMAENECNRVSCVPMVGGGTDYFGEAEDANTVWEEFRMNFEWFGNFKPYPIGHKYEYMPNTEGFKPTTVNLIRMAKRIGA